jgi:anaerobic magnesium-protoporphyrin IX monomethyl ester cyclase
MTLVLLVNPPNTTQVLDEVSCTVTRPEALTDWANVPSLGVLTLASALLEIPGVTPVYLDGTIVPWEVILGFVSDHAGDLLAVCASMLTASYEAGLALLRHAKAVRPGIATIAGNDHISALAGPCLTRQRDCIDFGFAGNEVVGPFRDLIADLSLDALGPPSRYPGLIAWTPDGLTKTPQRPEPLYTALDYGLIDAVYPHTPQYQANFATGVAPHGASRAAGCRTSAAARRRSVTSSRNPNAPHAPPPPSPVPRPARCYATSRRTGSSRTCRRRRG